MDYLTIKRFAALTLVGGLALAGCDSAGPDVSEATTANVVAASGSATLIDIDYSPEFSDAGENQFITTVLRGDGTYETYVTGSEGNDKTLVASTASGNGLLSGLVGQAFGPDVADKGNDFAFCRDIGSKVQCWSGEQDGGNVKYHQRNKFEVTGEFVSIEYSPKLSAPDYNAFFVTVDHGGTLLTFQYNTENNTPNHKADVGRGGLLQGVVGQAFGPDVADKGNDFAFCRDIGSKVQCWSGEQKNGEVEYHQRNKFEVTGEFVDLDYSPEFSTVDYNAFVLVVDNGGTKEVYQYNTENNTSGHKNLITSGAGSGNEAARINALLGQALGPDVANKGNDFRYAVLDGSGVEYWIGEQKDGDLKYHQRGRWDVGT